MMESEIRVSASSAERLGSSLAQRAVGSVGSIDIGAGEECGQEAVCFGVRESCGAVRHAGWWGNQIGHCAR